MLDSPPPQGDPHGHLPVLLEASMEALQPQAGDTIVDCTAGRGGHASVVAKAIQPQGQLILFDLDEANLSHASHRVREESGLETVTIGR